MCAQVYAYELYVGCTIAYKQGALRYYVVCCSAMQCDAVCCSVLHLQLRVEYIVAN